MRHKIFRFAFFFLVIYIFLKWFVYLLAISPENLMSPESIVGWLLEHPEVAAEDTESVSSVYESDTESISYDNALGQCLCYVSTCLIIP